MSKSKFAPNPKTDPQARLVYEAESWAFEWDSGPMFASLQDVRDWLEKIYATAWFQNRFGAVTSGFAVHGGGRSTWARGGSDDNGVCHIWLPRSARLRFFVLHELTHGLVDGHEGHGRLFCSTYLKLVKRFMGYESWEDLERAFQSCGVKYRRPSVRRTEPPDYLPYY